MKTINSQLYGLEAELDRTSETNGTTCFCVDNGEVYVAYGGIWYEQRGVYWKVGGAAESDLSGYSRYIPSAAAIDDLVCFNAQDTGDRYVAFSGHWFKQPIPWSDTAILNAAAAQVPAELPAVTTDDNGDVLTVVSGAWAKAAPSGGGGGLVVHGTEVEDQYVLDKTWQEIYEAASAGRSVVLVATDPAGVIYLVACRAPGFPSDSYTVVFAYENGLGELDPYKFICAEATGYPAAPID